MTTSSWFVALSSAVILSLMVVASTIGLSVGKWVHNTGGVFMLDRVRRAAAAAVHRPRHRAPARVPPAPHAACPAVSLFNLNILGKMGFGALGGFEYIAILAGETRSPARSVGRSVLIAAPVIALMFVLGTSTVVAYIPTDDIDLIGPMAQVLRVGFGPFGIADAARDDRDPDDARHAHRAGEREPSPRSTRLPMVAGWDRLLPPWFSRLHADVPTPVNSILLVGAASFGDRVVEPDRRRPGGGVPAAVQRERNVLRADVRRDVRDPAVRAARRHAAAAAVAAGSRRCPGC